MKLLPRLWNLNKRWQSSLLMSSSSSASPGHHDDEIMRGGEAMKEWDLDLDFLKRRWWTSWSDEVIKGKYCFRQDLEVPKEGNYFSFKGDPRSETNQEVKRKVKWLHKIQLIWDYWLYYKEKVKQVLSDSWLTAALDQLLPQEDKVNSSTITSNVKLVVSVYCEVSGEISYCGRLHCGRRPQDNKVRDPAILGSIGNRCILLNMKMRVNNVHFNCL